MTYKEAISQALAEDAARREQVVSGGFAQARTSELLQEMYRRRISTEEYERYCYAEDQRQNHLDDMREDSYDDDL